MYHYDPITALDELRDDALLPHPVQLRDMILRTKLDPITAVDLNREFQDYLARFGETQKIARAIFFGLLDRRLSLMPRAPPQGEPINRSERPTQPCDSRRTS